MAAIETLRYVIGMCPNLRTFHPTRVSSQPTCPPSPLAYVSSPAHLPRHAVHPSARSTPPSSSSMRRLASPPPPHPPPPPSTRSRRKAPLSPTSLPLARVLMSYRNLTPPIPLMRSPLVHIQPLRPMTTVPRARLTQKGYTIPSVRPQPIPIRVQFSNMKLAPGRVRREETLRLLERRAGLGPKLASYSLKLSRTKGRSPREDDRFVGTACIDFRFVVWHGVYD